MAKIDKQYNELLQRILDEGIDKGDRTGTGTRSIFHHTFEYDMKDGFPLLTTKKMFTKGIITELLWFLSGETNIRPLVLQGNNIWVGDAHKKYLKENVALLYESEASKLLDGYQKNGVKREDFIELIKTDTQFADKWGELGPIYGKQWVQWSTMGKGQMMNGLYTVEENLKMNSINQIQQVIDTLNTNPDSRRIMVSAWNPSQLEDMALPPCHWAFEFYTEELTGDERIELWYQDNQKETGKRGIWEIDYIEKSDERKKLDSFNIPKRRLSLKWHQRSVDFGLGLGFNIASYALLLEMFAQQVNMIPGMLVGDLTNVHIYNNHIEPLKGQLKRDVNKYEAPTLELNNSYVVDAGDNGERFFKDIFSYTLDDIKISNYGSFPTIKMGLSN